MVKLLDPLPNAIGASGQFQGAVTESFLDEIFYRFTRTASYSVPAERLRSLKPQDQRALAHLVKAADILNDVYLQQDNPHNLAAKAALEEASAAGDSWARKALRLFNIFNGVSGFNRHQGETAALNLFEGIETGPGKGFYPADLTPEQLKEYIKKYAESDPSHIQEILSNDTMIVWDTQNPGRLKAIPYSEYFGLEMREVAKHLRAAARSTSDPAFARYLRKEARALTARGSRKKLNKLRKEADLAWIDVPEDCPIEFTIGRESYADRMTTQISSDDEIDAILKAHNIHVNPKDSIGVRVGLSNPQYREELNMYRDALRVVSEMMPGYAEYGYKQNLDKKLSVVDVDLVALTGDYAAVRGGITVAQNLPNDDKEAHSTGGRLVFHRQVRQRAEIVENDEKRQKLLNATVNPDQHGWYDDYADFMFTAGHELGHSIGPSENIHGGTVISGLGKYGAMFEESKADLVSIFMTQYLVDTGQISEELANKIYLTWAMRLLPDSKPTEDEAHRSREIMQLNYFIEHGAIIFDDQGRMSIVPEKMQEVSRSMLEEVLRMQYQADQDGAKAFVSKYFVWGDVMQRSMEVYQSLGPKYYLEVQQPQRDALVLA